MISDGEIFPPEKTFSRKPYTPTPAPYVTCTMLACYKDFKYTQTLHQPYTTPTPEPEFFRNSG